MQKTHKNPENTLCITNVSHNQKMFDMVKNVKYHKKLIMRTNADKEKPCSIYLRITINRVQLRITTPIRVKEKEFNPDTEEIRIQGDPKKSHDYTRVLASIAAKAENVFTKYMIMEVPLTVEKFKKEWHIYNNRNSFLAFMENEIADLEQSKSRTKSTITVYKTILGKLTDFNPKLSFNEMDETWAESFERYLNSNLLGVNTKQKAHKTVKKFVNIALDKKIMFTDPYRTFKVKRIQANRHHLSFEELRKLIDIEVNGNLTLSNKNTLRAFLFSCYTGVRLSDCSELDSKAVINNVLTFLPLKTKDDNIMVKIPLSLAAQELINKTGKLLNCVSHQKMNDALKIIAHIAGIETNLTFHIARHTFGTHYILSGGNPMELMHLMGHRKIDTTLIYVHMAEEQKAAKEGINKFHEYLKGSSPLVRVK